MGWSCSAAAGETLRKIVDVCVKTYKMANVFYVNNTRYMFEESRREYDDGRITGQILRFEEGSETRASRVGGFCIGGDGSIVRGPAFFKQVVASAAHEGDR
jgi:hypothetical protein